MMVKDKRLFIGFLLTSNILSSSYIKSCFGKKCPSHRAKIDHGSAPCQLLCKNKYTKQKHGAGSHLPARHDYIRKNQKALETMGLYQIQLNFQHGRVKP